MPLYFLSLRHDPPAHPDVRSNRCVHFPFPRSLTIRQCRTLSPRWDVSLPHGALSVSSALIFRASLCNPAPAYCPTCALSAHLPPSVNPLSSRSILPLRLPHFRSCTCATYPCPRPRGPLFLLHLFDISRSPLIPTLEPPTCLCPARSLLQPPNVYPSLHPNFHAFAAHLPLLLSVP